MEHADYEEIMSIIMNHDTAVRQSLMHQNMNALL